MIDDCNDVLALMGHANKQINLAKKDFLRPELNKDYSHLCSHSRPFTSQLFGDDVSKFARELEECSKISSKTFQSRPFRGPLIRRMAMGSRFRGAYGRGFRGRGYPTGYGSSQMSTVGGNTKLPKTRRESSTIQAIDEVNDKFQAGRLSD